MRLESVERKNALQARIATSQGGPDMMASILPPILAQVHDLVRRVLRPGDVAVDATVGNGQDTLFLAECVGPTGRNRL